MSKKIDRQPNSNILSRKLLFTTAIVFLGVVAGLAIDHNTHNLPSYNLARAFDTAQHYYFAAAFSDPGQINSLQENSVFDGTCFSLSQVDIKTTSQAHYRVAITTFTDNCPTNIVPLTNYQREEPLNSSSLVEGVSTAFGPVSGNYEWPADPTNSVKPLWPTRDNKGNNLQLDQSVSKIEKTTGLPMGGIVIDQKGHLTVANAQELDKASKDGLAFATMSFLVTDANQNAILNHSSWTVLGLTQEKAKVIYAFSAYAAITRHARPEAIYAINEESNALLTLRPNHPKTL